MLHKPKTHCSLQKHTKKKQRIQKKLNLQTAEKKEKAVHWNEEELQSFTVQYPNKNFPPNMQQVHNLPTQHCVMSYPTFFQTAPLTFHPSTFLPAATPANAVQHLQEPS
jgi:hypothetical protein